MGPTFWRDFYLLDMLGDYVIVLVHYDKKLIENLLHKDTFSNISSTAIDLHVGLYVFIKKA